MERDPLISIIVPVYNTEKYLGACIESIRKQTYTNLEILLVDDASTDGSGDICRAYQKLDSRIRFISKPQNEGVSEARNTGIREAEGAFLNFFDSDDLMAPEMLEKLYRAMEKNNADMAICAYLWIDSDGRILKRCPLPAIDATDKLLVYRLLCSGELTCIPDPKLYRREVFDGIRFPPHKKYEDVFIFPLIMERCRIITSISDELTMYRIHPDAFTKSAYCISHMDIVEANLYFYRYAVSHRIDFLASELKLQAYRRLIEAIKRCRFRRDEQARIRQLRTRTVKECGIHIKYTAMVYLYYGMRKLRIPLNSSKFFRSKEASR